MRPGLNASADERDMWFWQQEQDALTMREAAQWRKDSAMAERWLAEANRLRLLRWPKDRPFQPIG